MAVLLQPASVQDSLFFRSDEPLDEEDETWLVEEHPEHGMTAVLTAAALVLMTSNEVEDWMRYWNNQGFKSVRVDNSKGEEPKWFHFDAAPLAIGADDPETMMVTRYVENY